jgi:hypothetical protein
MKKARVPLIFHLLSVVIAGLAFIPGQAITFTAQWPLFESLRTTASIIFAILGAWIAIVYPNALKKVLTLTRAERDGELAKLANLMRAVFFATIIVAVIIVLGPVAPVLKQFAWFTEHSVLLRGASFSLLAYLTFVQLWTLLLSVAPAELLNKEVLRIFGHQDGVEDFKRAKTG